MEVAKRKRKLKEVVIQDSKLFDTHLEEDLISHLLEYPHNFNEVSKVVDADSFTDELNKAVFFEFAELSAEKNTFTRFDVFRALKSKKIDLPNIGNVLTMLPNRVFSFMDVAMEVKELQRKRILDSIANKIKSAIDENISSGEISSIIDSSVEELEESSKSDEVYAVSDIYDKAMLELEINSESTRSFSGVDTGSRKLNYVLGGWQEGMSIVAGRPAMGKTIVGLEHAKAAAMSGKRVLFLSLEMPKEALIYRMISSEVADYSYSDIMANRITREQVARIKQSNANQLKKLPIFFYDSDNRDINYLSMIVTSEVRRNKIDIVFIDYLQLISDNSIRNQDDFSQVSRVSNKIQKLSRKLKLPIVCLSQLSRDIEKRTNRQPQLSDLRSSGNLEQDAIVVIGLYRDDYYKYVDAKNNGTRPAENDNTLKYIVLKNRNGQVCDVTRYIDVRTNRLADEHEVLFRPTTGQEVFQVLSNDGLNSVVSDFDVMPF